MKARLPFFIVKDVVFSEKSKLSTTARLVALAVGDRLDKGSPPACVEKVGDIGRRTGLDERTVRRAIGDLVKAGVFARERRWSRRGRLADRFVFVGAKRAQRPVSQAGPAPGKPSGRSARGVRAERPGTIRAQRPGNGLPLANYRRDHGRTDVRVSHSTGHEPEREELLAVCKELGTKLKKSTTFVVELVSTIPPSNGRDAKRFADPYAKGVSLGWVRAALNRARVKLAEARDLERTVPL